MVQIVIERSTKEKNLPELDKSKFLVPEELSMSQLVNIIRSVLVVMVIKYCTRWIINHRIWFLLFCNMTTCNARHLTVWVMILHEYLYSYVIICNKSLYIFDLLKLSQIFLFSLKNETSAERVASILPDHW